MSSRPPRPAVLLTGATGFIGRHLHAALTRDGHRVVAASRRTGADFMRMLAAADWRPWLDGVQAVVNAVGLIGESDGRTFEALHTRAPVALFDACRRAGVRRVIQLSALGADATAFSAYHLSKRAADDHLRSLGLQASVLRPSLVYGPGGASTAALLRLAGLPVVPVPGDGGQRIQPVHVGDVVDAVRRCLADPHEGGTVDVVGPEAITFAEWLQALRGAAGRPPATLLHVPGPLVRIAIGLARPFHPMARLDTLRMLEAGNTADPAPFARLLGRAPRAATPECLAELAAATAAGSLA